MDQLIIEMGLYLGAAALIGLLLGFAVWGWGRRRKLEEARVEGTALARTSVDGSSAAREQLAEKGVEIERLEREIQTLRHRLEAQQAKRDRMPEQDPEPVETSLDDSVSANPEDTLEADVSETAEDDAAVRPENADETDTSEILQLGVAHLKEPPQAEIPEDADDLTLIRGIDAKMAAILNETGVYSYHELARLTSTDVEWLTAEIKVPPGRIEREDWIGQAKLLDIETYGRQNYS